MLESGQRCPPKISRNAAERDVVSITDRNLASESYAIDGRAVDPVLRSYRRALTGATVHPIERPGFSGALVHRIETPGGSFCLRGWPPGVDPERLLALHEFLAYVRARGIDYLGVPLPSDDDCTLVNAGERWWQVEPWLPGTADFWSRPTDLRLAAAFVAVARFHVAACGFMPSKRATSHLAPAIPSVAPTVRDRVERIDRWTPRRVAEFHDRLAVRVARPGVDNCEVMLVQLAQRILVAFQQCGSRVAHELHASETTIVPLQPCLRDVWHDHVLFDGDRVSGLIDPAAARTDTVAADISRLAGSLIADDRRAWGLALDAYQSVRPLSAAETNLVGVLDRNGVVLSGMAWLERADFWENPQADFQTRVAERLSRIAAGMETLARSVE
jgi:Ser/Thr protein kinase RdoA (MazF antagonist)